MGRPRKVPPFPFEPGQLVEPIQSFASVVDGVDYTFNSKSKPVRADHPAVKANPYLFRAVDGQP